MSFAKTFGQRHVLRFLSSHIDLSGCRITAASPVGLRVTDGVHQLCLKSTDGCIQREDDPNSVAPEVIEVYGSTARRTAMTKRGELSGCPAGLRCIKLWNCRKASCVTFSRTRCSPMLMCAALWIPEVWMRTLTRVCSYGFLRQAVMGIGSFSAAVTK